MTGSNENGSFAGKVAFVTGAGSGMGRTTGRMWMWRPVRLWAVMVAGLLAGGVGSG